MKKILFLILTFIVYFGCFSQNNINLYIQKNENKNAFLIYNLSINGIHLLSSSQPSDLSDILSSSENICLYFQYLNKEEINFAINELPDDIVMKVKEINFTFLPIKLSIDITPLSRFKNVELLRFQDSIAFDMKPKVWLENFDELCNLKKIVSLSFNNVNVNQSFKICCFENLKYLGISFSNINIEGGFLSLCPRLKHLNFANSNNKIVEELIFEIGKHSTLTELTIVLQNNKQIEHLSNISRIERLNLFFSFPISEMKLDKSFNSLAKNNNLKSIHIKVNSKKRVIRKIPKTILNMQNIEELSIEFPLSEIDNLFFAKLKILRLYASNSLFLQDGQLESFRKINPNVEVIIENDIFKLSTQIN